MGLADFLARLVIQLDAAEVAYMISGSVASSVHGEPRSTQDIDLVVDLDLPRLQRLLAALDEDEYYVSPEAAREALLSRSQFNVIDLATGWKADLIVLKRRPFSREEFGRRREARLFGIDVRIATPEDVILAKLEWALKSGGSERQLRDVRGMITAPAQTLDHGYLDRWAAELGVVELLQRVRAG